jgi:hypothetical protein
VVKMALLDWEAAVLPLNYARLFYQLNHNVNCHFGTVYRVSCGAILVAGTRGSSLISRSSAARQDSGTHQTEEAREPHEHDAAAWAKHRDAQRF